MVILGEFLAVSTVLHVSMPTFVESAAAVSGSVAASMPAASSVLVFIPNLLG